MSQLVRRSLKAYGIGSWNPNEKVFVEALVGGSEGEEESLWAFMSKETFETLSEMAPIKLSRHTMTKEAKELGILEPSKLRKFSEQYMKEAFTKKSMELGEHPEVIMQFVQGRTGELKVSHLHYDNLLRKTDLVYSSWLGFLNKS